MNKTFKDFIELSKGEHSLEEVIAKAKESLDKTKYMVSPQDQPAKYRPFKWEIERYD